MKRISVEYIGVIASPNGEKQAFLEIDDNVKTIKDLLTILGYSEEHQKYIIIKLNDQDAILENIVENNCNITLFLPAGGG